MIEMRILGAGNLCKIFVNCPFILFFILKILKQNLKVLRTVAVLIRHNR